jgi:hypothetical protein
MMKRGYAFWRAVSAFRFATLSTPTDGSVPPHTVYAIGGSVENRNRSRRSHGSFAEGTGPRRCDDAPHLPSRVPRKNPAGPEDGRWTYWFWTGEEEEGSLLGILHLKAI